MAAPGDSFQFSSVRRRGTWTSGALAVLDVCTSVVAADGVAVAGLSLPHLPLTCSRGVAVLLAPTSTADTAPSPRQHHPAPPVPARPHPLPRCSAESPGGALHFPLSLAPVCSWSPLPRAPRPELCGSHLLLSVHVSPGSQVLPPWALNGRLPSSVLMKVKSHNLTAKCSPET